MKLCILKLKDGSHALLTDKVQVRMDNHGYITFLHLGEGRWVAMDDIDTMDFLEAVSE